MIFLLSLLPLLSMLSVLRLLRLLSSFSSLFFLFFFSFFSFFLILFCFSILFSFLNIFFAFSSVFLLTSPASPLCRPSLWSVGAFVSRDLVHTRGGIRIPQGLLSCASVLLCRVSICGVTLMCLFRNFLSLPCFCSCTSSQNVCRCPLSCPRHLQELRSAQTHRWTRCSPSDVLAQAATLEQGCAQTLLAVELLQAKETCTPTRRAGCNTEVHRRGRQTDQKKMPLPAARTRRSCKREGGGGSCES